MTFYDWRLAHGHVDMEANAGGDESSSAGPDDGIELIENIQQQKPAVAPAQANHHQQKDAPPGPSAGPSSAPTVVASSSAPTVSGDETPKHQPPSDKVPVKDANILASAQEPPAQGVGQQAQGQPTG